MAYDDRTKMLLGDENFEKLKSFNVCVIGLGGVGSIVPITLLRSGIVNLTIIDKDVVDSSNLNRQIAYDENDVGSLKSEALKKKLLMIRKNAKVLANPLLIDENFDFASLKQFDYVCDCIDDIHAKILLISYCINNGIKIISSLGMGNRINPSNIVVTKLNKTTIDPLAKKLRYELRKQNVNIDNINVVFSKNEPIIKSNIVSSMAFVPNSAGLMMASFVIEDLLAL
jgi:tRNA threonylcarbamoyladenosine dehydratase